MSIYEERGEKVKARQDYVAYLKLIANRPGEAAEKQRLEFANKIRELGGEIDDESVRDSMNTDAQTPLEPQGESISPEGFWVWGDWYGQVKKHNAVINGVQYDNLDGWDCGPTCWPPGSVTGVENIVYFALPSSTTNRTAYKKVGWWWDQVDWLHQYCWQSGWSCWPGDNYYMLVPERNVCLGYNAPAADHKIHGQYWTW